MKLFRRAADPVPQPPDTIVLELTLAEAELLQTLVANIGGSPSSDSGPIPMALILDRTFYTKQPEVSQRTRDLTDKIYVLMNRIGVYSLSRV